MQRSYEVMFIVRPDVLEEDMDKLIATLQGHATTAGASVLNTEKMGKRRLAYDVRKFSDRAGDQVPHRAYGRRAPASGQGR